ncbi:hypothetical protein CH293_17005 [Rhodococcus sp. 14-2470-1b]|uniref:hypothetical protein n=1 Tax=Rhodococcus sp. 14-2470-1b TaxID=2023149 RepID=UPI000B9C6A12|nr:hypothetical protein [Rhodococcus sp. 14-2470-1b]OZF49553.1 hypothetical protein CH293_17005 [Rhodococcus sp. 14-2470-1b]
MEDRTVAAALGRAVAIIDPVLDLLAQRDPVGLKGRTFRTPTDTDTALDKVLDTLASALDATDFPGTKGWQALDEDARSQWWVARIGALNTVAVAFPGVFGVLVNRLPLQDLLGFANQAMVLVAVARESGVTDRADHVRMLASVLCEREIDLSAPEPERPATPRGHGPFALLRGMWDVANVLRDVSDELAKRPRSRGVLRVLSAIPVVGGVAGYLGERGALSRAADEGRKWIRAHRNDASHVGSKVTVRK